MYCHWMTKIYNRTRKVGSGLSKAQSDYVTMIQTKYFRKLKDNQDFTKEAFEEVGVVMML